MSGLDVRALLVSGGDERIAIDPATGVNPYGHGPQPAPADIAFSSSTASTISQAAFAAVEQFADALARGIRTDGESVVYERECHRIRSRILRLVGCPPRSGIEIVLSPSGTDLHLLATLLYRQPATPLLTLTLEASETGSAVAMAASGSHFIAYPPSGVEVARGGQIAAGISGATFAVRNADGSLRDERDVEHALDARIAAAVETGHRCLLVVADMSKTGLIAPGLDTMFRLKARYGARLDIFIDACQLRLAPATIRAYLAHGFAVAITGSKFLGGPSFSGAMLCPAPIAARFRNRTLPPTVADYAAAAELPRGWPARRALGDRPNLGLLLRWHAALYEWEALLHVPADRATRTAQAVADAVGRRLRDDPGIVQIASRPIDRRLLGGGSAVAADCVPTIFPFALRRSGCDRNGIELLTADETAQIYRGVAKASALGPAIRLGQPIACAPSATANVSALRLCLSARMIVEASASKDGAARLVADALRALDRVTLASRALSTARQSIAA